MTDHIDALIERLEDTESVLREHSVLSGQIMWNGLADVVSEATTEIRRVAQEREAVGVAVKPLEWEPDPDFGGLKSGEYRVRAGIWTHGYYWTKDDYEAQTGFEDQDEAKAAAQADYEQRIRSALVSPPVEAQPDEGVREGRTAIGVIDTLLESLQEGLMTDANLTEEDRVAMQHQINALDTAKEEIEAISPLEPTAPQEVDAAMVERACRAHAPQWERIDPEIQSYARDQMRAALEPALNLGREG